MSVKCASYDYANDKWAELDVSVNLKVYPCCGYHAYYELNDWDDKRFLELTPDWNDLKKHDIETIKSTMFKILNVDNFNSGNCPQKCKDICGEQATEKYMPLRKIK